MPVRKLNFDAVGAYIGQIVDRIRGETGFRLLAVSDHRRSGSFELLDSLSDRFNAYQCELPLRYASSVILHKCRDKLLRARDAPDRLGRDSHI